MPDEPQMNVDDLVDKMSDDRLAVAFKRAEREFGDCVADYESEEFKAEFAEQIKRLVAQDFTEELSKKGFLEPNGVDEDGNTIYIPTSAGKEIMG